MRIYFEIGPLKEPDYTGIAQVTAAIAEQLLGDSTVDSHFFFGRMSVAKLAVEDLLKRRNGELLEWYLERTPPQAVPHDLVGRNVALFPNRKTCRRAFWKECQIIHDLSTLLTPQFHHKDTIDYHATTLEGDISTNDLTFCVSDATRDDVLAYFPNTPPNRVHTMLLAPSVEQFDLDLPLPGKVEPYILVLGTIEPRKNASQVLRYIGEHPAFAKQHRFVFLGRFGWGTSIDKLIEEYGISDMYATGRVVFPGFVSEYTKCLLIRNSEVVIYPSLFEGFGLPLLEAASLGVPCVTTRSSSLPQAGGDACYYFDPFKTGDFDRALMKAILDLQLRGPEIRTTCANWSRRFTWDKSYMVMINTIRTLVNA